MPASTRSKRKQEGQETPVEPPQKRRKRLQNLTNLKSPPKKTSLEECSVDKVPNHFLPVVELHRWTPASSDVSTQAEFVVSQVAGNDGVSMMRSVKKVLEENFKDVSGRLQLQKVPLCLYDLKFCHKQHTKYEVKFAGSEILHVAKSFLNEDRHTQFIMFVRNNICGRKEFPGVAVIRGVLELILVSEV